MVRSLIPIFCKPKPGRPPGGGLFTLSLVGSDPTHRPAFIRHARFCPDAFGGHFEVPGRVGVIVPEAVAAAIAES